MLKKSVIQILIIGVFGIGIGIGYGQTKIPFYEQIAFDFYLTEIQTENPTNKRFRIYKELDPYPMTKDPFWYPKCLDNLNLKENDIVKNNVSGKSELDLSNLSDELFIIKEYGKGNSPKLFVSQSLSLNSNRIFVNVCEIYKWNGTYYHIELDKKGNIINWCKGGYVN